MQIAKDTVVAIDYRLTDDGGQLIDTSDGREPLAYLHGAGSIIPGLERALEGKSQGESLDVHVQADEAYGQRNEALVQQVPREQFNQVENLQAGMQFQAETEVGPMVITVVDVAEETVTVDGNHHLAGKDLNFAVNIREVRTATEEELNHGHAHGAGGHQH